MTTDTKSRSAAVPAVAGLVMALAVSVAAVQAARNKTPIEKTLNSQVTHFAENRPLIPLLILVARKYSLPLGIEKVTAQGLYTPISVRLHRGTARQLLDICVRAVPGYRWRVEDGVVNVYGAEEKASETNLFNFVVPRLEIHGGTLNEIITVLNMSIPGQLPVRYGTVPSGKAYATAGDSPGIGSLQGQRVDFEAHGETVRTILNRIVTLSKVEVVWIARVPPSNLNNKPSRGLWLIAPPFEDSILPNLGPIGPARAQAEHGSRRRN
jgi:hypothetical protein